MFTNRYAICFQMMIIAAVIGIIILALIIGKYNSRSTVTRSIMSVCSFTLHVILFNRLIVSLFFPHFQPTLCEQVLVTEV